MIDFFDDIFRQYKTTIVDFVNKQNGLFFIATHDKQFTQLFQTIITKQLGLGDSCINTVDNANKILKKLKNHLSDGKQLLLLIDNIFDNRYIDLLVTQVKNNFPEIKVIVLTSHIKQEEFILLHELGADNFISKSISTNIIIEKIAFTIKPQDEIGRLIELGKVSIEQHEYEKALIISREILKFKRNSAAGFMLMGDAYLKLGQHGKAVGAYQIASQQTEMFLAPLKKLAQFYQQTKNQKEQIKYLEKLNKISPLNIERKVDMGRIYIDLGNERRAEDLFDEAVAQAEQKTLDYIKHILLKIGNIYSEKNFEKAVIYYQNALGLSKKLNKNDIKIFNSLGIALRRQGKWQEAIQEYKKAIQIAPKDENLFYNLAMAYIEGEDYIKAYDAVSTALDINKKFYINDCILSYNIGLIYMKINQTDLARNFFEHALKLEPNFKHAKKH